MWFTACFLLSLPCLRKIMVTGLHECHVTHGPLMIIMISHVKFILTVLFVIPFYLWLSQINLGVGQAKTPFIFNCFIYLFIYFWGVTSDSHVHLLKKCMCIIQWAIKFLNEAIIFISSKLAGRIRNPNMPHMASHRPSTLIKKLPPITFTRSL